MEKCSLEGYSSSWIKLLNILSLQRGIEMAENFIQRTNADGTENCFHWPCFLKHLTSCAIVMAKDHTITEKTHYAGLPYTIRVNLLTLLLHQHVMIGHRELGKFVDRLKKEVCLTDCQTWESNLLGRLEELVEPPSLEAQHINVVHLSDHVIKMFTNDWSSGTNATEQNTGSLVSWSSKEETGSLKRPCDHLGVLREPPGKKSKIVNDVSSVTSAVLLEEEATDGTEVIQQEGNTNSLLTKGNPSVDYFPVITKLKCLCSDSSDLSNKEMEIIWEELVSIDPDQLECNLKVLLQNNLKEQGVVNMLYFMASMPIVANKQIGACFASETVLPYLLDMKQPASRSLVAAFSCVAKKQPLICIESVITPLLQRKQFGSNHSDFVSALIRGGDFGDYTTSLWRIIVAVNTRSCWNDHVISLAQTLLDAKIKIDGIMISETLQALLHIASYMTGNIRFGKLLLAIVSRHQALVAAHLEDLELLVTMVSPAFMQRSLRLAVKKLQG